MEYLSIHEEFLKQIIRNDIPASVIAESPLVLGGGPPLIFGGGGF